MMGGARKQVKARRRAISRLINSATASKDKSVPTATCSNGGSGSKPCSSANAIPCDTAKTSTEALTKVSSKNVRGMSGSSSGNSTVTKATGKCIVCGVPSKMSCSACYTVNYCSKAHQRKHWNEGGHKTVCCTWTQMSPNEHKDLAGPLGKGPYIKASRDLFPMEKIYEEHPLMTGPGCCLDTEYEPVCLGCTDPVQESQKCSKCDWPLCGSKCEKDTLHEKYECEIFAKNNVQELKDPFQYELVRILRCLLTKHKDPDAFQQLMTLDGALEHRRKLSFLVEATTTACQFIRENCRLTEYDTDTIDRICGVVDLQTQVSGKLRSSMQIFTFPSKLAHDCVSNTRFCEVIQPNGENLLQVIAVRSIKKGEPLTQRRLIGLLPTYERQIFLRRHYYFQCKCKLCRDPYEKGSYFSALKCPVCYESRSEKETNKNLHYVVPVTPTHLSSPWKCNYCRAEFTAEAILGKLEICDQRLWNFKFGILPSLKESEDRIEAIAKKVDEYEISLHPNHFFVWQLKQILFNELTETIQLMMPPTTWKRFMKVYETIEDLATSVMTTVQIMQPGLTVNRGISLHDLVTAYWSYIQWAVVFGKADSFDKHLDSKEFYKLIKEALAILEPEVTETKRIAAVKFMRDNVQEIKKRVQGYERNVTKAEKLLK